MTSDVKESTGKRSTARFVFIAVISLVILFTTLVVSVIEIVVCNSVHSYFSGTQKMVGRHFMGARLGDKNAVSVTIFDKYDFKDNIVPQTIAGFQTVADAVQAKIDANQQPIALFRVRNRKLWDAFTASKSEDDFNKACTLEMALIEDRDPELQNP